MANDDLFAVPARARRTDPETSHKAAEAIDPFTGTIRQQVEAFAMAKGEGGFIDEALSLQFDAAAFSSYRTRRAELTDCNIILDSGRRQSNAGGRECVVWVHRAFVAQPPSVREPTAKPPATEADAAVRTLQRWARQMRNEGRLFVTELDEAIGIVERAAAGR